MKPLKILCAASEALPFASSGGLGDVIGSLPKALMGRYGDELDIRVVLPLYKSVPQSFRDEMTRVAVITVPLAWRRQYCGIYSLVRDGVTYYFIDNEYYFARQSLYGSFDDGERYAFFSKAVLEKFEKLSVTTDTDVYMVKNIPNSGRFDVHKLVPDMYDSFFKDVSTSLNNVMEGKDDGSGMNESIIKWNKTIKSNIDNMNSEIKKVQASFNKTHK